MDNVITPDEIFKEAMDFMGPGSYYQCTAYDTNLLISDAENYDSFHHFELFERKILWINQAKQSNDIDGKPLMARTIFACSEDEFDGHIVAHRFSSLLCYASHAVAIHPRVWVGGAMPVPSVTQPSERFVGTLVTHEQIDSSIRRLDPNNMAERKWIALAHYRQAVLANTPYHQVLSYWKILELYFNRQDADMNSYINDFYAERPDIFHDIPAFTGTASRKLRDMRNLSAHFELTGGDIQDPDNPDLYNIASQAIFSLKRLTEKLIDERTDW